MKDSYRICGGDASADRILGLLDANGMCVVDGWLSKATMTPLRAELEDALSAAESSGGSLGSDIGHFNAGRFARLTRAEIAETYPATHAVFSDPMFDELAHRYIAGAYSLNDEIFVTDHRMDARHILPLHYDRLWCLKFYVYLKDTAESDGAFTALPGSHRAARRRRLDLLARGVCAKDLPNREDPLHLSGARPIVGGAGTLIVFDTDTLHKGGIVAEGGRRLVMRGHTHKRPQEVYNPPFWSRQGLREYPMNPVTAARRALDRMIRADLSLKL